jgi:DNA-directed RNA polymerase sigma subunit (sigma70/sigma32)
MAEALSHLPEREQRILRLRFWIGGTAEHTLEEVGKSSPDPRAHPEDRGVSA